MKKILFFLIAALGLLSACSKYKYETIESDPLQTRIYTLDNGLKVYMSVNREEPRIQTFIAVKVGAKNDPSETTGLAHYFEHLMFKGTPTFGTSDYAAEKPMLDQIEQLFETYRQTTDEAERLSIYRQIDSISYEASKLAIPNEYDKLMSAIGAVGTNAWTSMDETVYTEDIPANQVENWARIQADRFKHPVIRGFHTELETIYEEKNMSLTDDGNKVWYALDAALFPNHPYGKQDVLGTQEHLKNPSITNVLDYHENYYVPNNMAICLSGDFDPDEMIATIDKYFGDMVPNENLPKLDFAAERPIATPVVKEVVGLEAENVTIGWRTGKAAAEDAEYAQLAGMILSNGKAGLLDIDLIRQQKVLSAYAYSYQQADYGSIMLGGRPKAGQTLDQVRDLLLGEVAKLRDGRFDEKLLTATANNLKAGLMWQMDSNSGRAQMYVSSFIDGIDWADEVGSIARLEAITKDQLVAWAQKNLGAESYAIVYKREGEDTTVQKMPKPELTPIEMNRDSQSEFLTEIQNTVVKPIEPVFVDFEKDMDVLKTDSGIEVLYKKNETNDLFQLTYLFETGTLNDPTLNDASTYMSYLGTQAKTAARIASELYEIACSYQLTASQNRCYVSFSGLSENMGRVMDIFEELVAGMQGDEAILTNYKADRLKARTDAKLSQDANFGALQRHAFYGGETLRRISLSNEQLEQLQSDELIEKIQALMGKRHTILYYGPKSPEEVLADLKAHHHTPEKMEPVNSDHLQMQATPEDRVYLAQYDAPQLYFMQYADLDRMFDVSADPAQMLYNEYTGTIVYQEMREARGLAYSAYTHWSTPSFKEDDYAFYAVIATQNDKMTDAIAAFEQVINEMPESEAAFDIAKEAVLTQVRTLRTIKANVLWMYVDNRDMGLTEDRNKAIFERVQGMTLGDLKATQQEWIKGRNYFYCILGDLQALDQEYLRSLGPVTVLSQEEIFGY